MKHVLRQGRAATQVLVLFSVDAVSFADLSCLFVFPSVTIYIFILIEMLILTKITPFGCKPIGS